MRTLNDIDGHLQMNPSQLSTVFGDEASVLPGQPLSPVPRADAAQARAGRRPDPQSVWAMKGAAAYGASSASERLEVLDAMGVRCQLVLPRVRVALAAWHGLADGRDTLVERFNEFMAEWQKEDPRRLFGVGVVTMTKPSKTLAQIEAARRLGLRALLFPCFEAPGGFSPGGSQWDAVWKAVADANMTIVLHAGSEQRFLSAGWTPDHTAMGFSATPHMLRQKIDVATVDMFKLLTMSYGPQVFLSSLLVGGVLVRYPALRIAVAEFGASWLAPFVAMLDAHAEEFAGLGAGDARRPSELLLRCLRIAPSHWEPVEHFLIRDEMSRFYCFSTDFPHSEGGQQTLAVAESRLGELPREIVQGYFHDNASLIFER
jgi:predicted TIM-barrel fold metal-dependent hydrolase